MQFATPANGPSLTEVLAFTLVESPEDVARVERLAANRMAAARGWYGWRVKELEFSEIDDGLVRITAHVDPVGAGYRPDHVSYVFITDGLSRRSQRFESFLRACGVTERIDDDREIKGRYFATRNRGRSVRDFGPLTNALVAS